MDHSAPPIVDFEIVRANTLGDEAFERSLLGAFLEDNAERVALFRAALGAKDGEALELEAHSLKGAAATLGAKPLADAARALEAAAAARRFDDAGRCVVAVERELARVQALLTARLAPDDG